MNSERSGQVVVCGESSGWETAEPKNQSSRLHLRDVCLWAFFRKMKFETKFRQLQHYNLYLHPGQQNF